MLGGAIVGLFAIVTPHVMSSATAHFVSPGC
jgi:hypothetical protein